jgi:hypothetical protein
MTAKFYIKKMNKFIILTLLIASIAANDYGCSTAIPNNDYSGRSGCAYCKEGFKLAAANDKKWVGCEKCEAENCAKCTTDKANCTSCKTGFYLKTGDKNTCEKCAVENCSSCIQDSGKCQMCKSGYFLFKDGDKDPACKKNDVKNCATYDLATGFCTSCQTGFGLVADTVKMLTQAKKSSCPACKVKNCGTCDGDVSKCPETGCKFGFFFENGKCTACSKNCMMCSSADKCDSCNSGFGLKVDGDKKTCEKCKVKNCSNCGPDFNKCQSCDAGYKPPKEDKCEEKYTLPKNCESLAGTDEKICGECKDKFFRNVTDKTETANTAIGCGQCGKNCNTCESDKFCWTCKTNGWKDKEQRVCGGSKMWIWIVLVVVVLGAGVGFFLWKKGQDGDEYQKESTEEQF